MDPTRYWMLARRKLGDQKPPPHFTTPSIAVGGSGSSSVCYYESWEERAFAEDSAGHLGGCIWPPRSYSCSFCGREFRSAQALGGHMNVHRRDRARLKLSGAAEDGGRIMSAHQGYMIKSCPPPTTTLQHAYGSNPSAPSTGSTNPNPICSVLPYPPRSLVQAAAARTVWGKQVLGDPLCSPSAWKDNGKKDVFVDASQLPQDGPRSASRMCCNPELRAGSEELKLSILGCRTRRDFIDVSDDEEIVHLSCKRRRIDLEKSPSILCSPSHKDHKDDGDEKINNGSKVLNLCPTSAVEELDLELRLGEAPTVK
ncbi:hypothetical protein ACP4OV_016279 [Aristida adscensionis]